ncbi:MAG: Uma2 family endonuclease [Chloroflexota bacterium]
MTVQVKPRKRTRRFAPLYFDFTPDIPISTNGDDAPSKSENIEFASEKEENIYGWRDIYQTDEDGNEKLVRVALTLDDYLHPQEGDMHVQNRSHNRTRRYVETAMRIHLAHIPNHAVYGDVGIDWGVSGEGYYVPDVSIFYDVYNQHLPQGIFYVAQEGTAPSVVVEVTSPTTRHVDLGDKYEAYERLGVPCLIFSDTVGTANDGSEVFQLMGYDWTPNGYVPITPNEQGWLWMEPVSAWIGLHENQVRCYDVDGHYIRRPEELADALTETSEQLAETSEQLAEASEQLVEETVARTEAERRAEEAERRAQEEANARLLLEEQIRALQAQLNAQSGADE